MDAKWVREAYRLVGDAQLLWTACTDALRTQVSDGVWLSTFADASPIHLADGVLSLAVPTAWAKERIESRHLDLLRAALADAGSPGLGVRIEVGTTGGEGAGAPGGPITDAPIALEPLPATPARPTETPRTSDTVNPKYTFATFVTGASNRFAHAAALSVAETPARSYNPLFIYGHSGLGKTHLLQAIGHYVRENYTQHRVRYVSTETFLNEFVESIRTGTGDAFKRRYRDVDVLLVDDIQFIEGKKETQEEFFHTFNTLHEANRQIVLSSDRAPDAISTLEDRLRGRFKMGLITDIQPPDLETRIAILRKKAERERTAIPPDVLEFIATHITDNIRVLEGALIRVAAFASLTKEKLTIELAERVLGDILTDRQPRQITPVVILDATSRMFGFSIEEIKGKSRRRPLVTSRQIAMYVFRELTDLSYPAIAREFGGRDHTTVMHAVEKISALMGERRQIYEQVTELTQSIKTSG